MLDKSADVLCADLCPGNENKLKYKKYIVTLLHTTLRTKTEPHEHKCKLSNDFIGRTHDAFIQSRIIVTNKPKTFTKIDLKNINSTILITTHAEETRTYRISLHYKFRYVPKMP